MEELFILIVFLVIASYIGHILTAIWRAFVREQNKQRQEQQDDYYQERYGEVEPRSLDEEGQSMRLDGDTPLQEMEAEGKSQMDPDRDWRVDSESTWGEDWKNKLEETHQEAQEYIKRVHEEMEQETLQQVDRRRVVRPGMKFDFDSRSILQGVVFSEIIGRPSNRRGSLNRK